MKHARLTLLGSGILLLAGLAAIPAQASDAPTCTVPRNERQPSVRLQSQLRAAGWWIRKIEIEHGCYEVYGTDETGKPIQAMFDPRTLQRIAVAR